MQIVNYLYYLLYSLLHIKYFFIHLNLFLFQSVNQCSMAHLSKFDQKNRFNCEMYKI